MNNDIAKLLTLILVELVEELLNDFEVAMNDGIVPVAFQRLSLLLYLSEFGGEDTAVVKLKVEVEDQCQQLVPFFAMCWVNLNRE